MRTLRKNNQNLKYAYQIGEVEQYETDEQGNIKYVVSYVDDNGNVYYETDINGNRIPITTGEKEIIYCEPVSFQANISEQTGGDAQALPNGISTQDYEATILYQKGAFPLKEGTLIWKGEPEYEYNGEAVTITLDDGTTVTQKIVKETSADYRIIKLSDSLNYTLAILKAMNK